jgi:hypothetical protein
LETKKRARANKQKELIEKPTDFSDPPSSDASFAYKEETKEEIKPSFADY